MQQTLVPKALAAAATVVVAAFAAAPHDAAAQAATVPAPAAAPLEAVVADGQRGGEPVVARTVIDDGRARIEELRVRGQLQKVTVDTKGRLPSYEIVTVEGSKDISDNGGSQRGPAGKRVWNVFKF